MQGPEGATAAPPAAGAALPWARPELAAGQELEVQLAGVWHAAAVREVQPGGWALLEVEQEDLDAQWAMDAEEEGEGSEGAEEEEEDGGEAGAAPERPGSGTLGGAGVGAAVAASAAGAATAAAAAEHEDGADEEMDHDGSDGEEAAEVTLLRVQLRGPDVLQLESGELAAWRPAADSFEELLRRDMLALGQRVQWPAGSSPPDAAALAAGMAGTLRQAITRMVALAEEGGSGTVELEHVMAVVEELHREGGLQSPPPPGPGGE